MKTTRFFRDRLTLSLAETGAGQPMVFQHGLCGDAAQPAQVFPEGAGFGCLTLESRGHGASEAGDPESFRIATFAADVAAMIDERRLGPVVVGGISMGAAIALHLAVFRPDLVRGLVLARPAWLFENAPGNMAPMAVVGMLLREFPAERAAEIFEQSKTAETLMQTGPDNLASLKGFFRRQPLAVTAELLTRISADGPGVSREQVGAITVPTLVIGHERDAVHPFAHAVELAATLPAARLVEITPKATSLERYTREFAAALAEFLQTLG